MTEYKARKIARILNGVLTMFSVRAKRLDATTWVICFAEPHRRNEVLFENEVQALAFMNGIEVPATCAEVGCNKKALWRTRRVANGARAFYYVCRDHEYLYEKRV